MCAKNIAVFFASLLALSAAPQENVDGLLPPLPGDMSDFSRGYAQLRQGNFYDAIRALRRAEHAGTDPNLLKALAISYYGAHQQRLFLLEMRTAQRTQPGDFAPYYYLGRYYDTDLEDFPRAAAYFQQALERRPDHFRSHYYLGHCYEAEGKLEQAATEYRKALAAKDGLAEQGLARLHLAANHPADALPFAKSAVAARPRDAAGHKLLARAYFELRHEEEAMQEWKISVELDPTDAAARFRLYRSYQAFGRAQEARAALAEYRRIAALYGTN